MKFKSRFNFSRSDGLFCDPVGDKAKQEFREECDINYAVSHFMKTGSAPGSRVFTARYPQFGDFSGVRDLTELIALASSSQAAFLELPAAVRKEVGGSVEGLISFLKDPRNIDRASQLGLVEIKSRPVEDQPPQKVPSDVTSLES